MDLYRAAIRSNVNYGNATLRETETLGGELQHFASRRIREIKQPKFEAITNRPIKMIKK